METKKELEQKITSEVKKENEKITLTRTELEAIVDARVEKGLRGGVKPLKRVTTHTATMRVVDGKPVVEFGNVRQTKEKDPRTGNLIATMDIKLLGEDKPRQVNYLDFLNASDDFQGTRVNIEIKKQEAKEVVSSQGSWRTQNSDEANVSGKNKNWQSEDTDLEVVSYEYYFDIEVLDGDLKGQKFNVPNHCLNQ